ncbi:GNAT family N-acetyltransferase [Spirillospora sp. NPDC127200]
MDNEYPTAPEVERAFREAQRALEPLAGRGFLRESKASLSEIALQLPLMVDQAYETLSSQLGPLIWWEAPSEEGWEPIIAVHNFDDSAQNIDEIELAETAYRGPDDSWSNSSLGQAARAYRRDAGWDFPPGDTGIWLLMLAPESKTGEDENGVATHKGHLIGFMMVCDYDEDGIYECVANMWTAAAWRRRGVAKKLFVEAQRRFSIIEVQGPYTEDGAAFLQACPIDH